jgi:hypothetical protein
MAKCYIKVINHDLSAAQISIYTCPPDVDASNLTTFVKRSQKAADKRGINATYSGSTGAEYRAFAQHLKDCLYMADILKSEGSSPEVIADYMRQREADLPRILAEAVAALDAMGKN